MRPPEYSIAVRSPGGAWEQLGAGELSDIVPENIEHSHALPGGPERLSFQLKRDSRQFLPDELPFTEAACMLGGVPCWSGRLMRSPRSRALESVVSPVAEGWAISHLQDYPIDREWVVDDLSRWVDLRSVPSCSLQYTRPACGVVHQDGSIVLSWASNGQPYVVYQTVGVLLDLGPNNLARSIVVEYETTGNSTAINMSAATVSHPDIHAVGQVHTAAIGTTHISNWGAGPNTLNGTFATPQRYVVIYMHYPPGAAGTAVTDYWAKIKRAIVFTDSADRSGNASILKASTVISEALALAPKISTDHSGIATTTFSIPAYGTGGRRSIWDVAADVNNYHQYQFFLTPESPPRPIYRPVPTTPTWIVRESDAYAYDDAGANEGAEIFKTCILQYEDATGIPAEAVATATGTILDRVGYDRAKVLQARSPMTSAAATQIAQAYVAAFQSSPFKGKIRISGTIERATDGSRIPVGLITAGDAVVLGSETDPDTGLAGRIGIIQKVTYRHDRLEAELELDSSRTYIDALLARMAIVSR